MQRNPRSTGRVSSMPKGIAAGVLAALSLTCILGAVLAVLIGRGVILQENMGYWIMAILFAASAAGGSLSYRKIRHRRALVYALTAGLFFASLFSLTALFFGGRFEGLIPTAVLIIGGSGTDFFLSGVGRHTGRTQTIPKQFR